MARFISTFLSHSSHDKALVRQVARELARRGVIPWLDEQRLPLGCAIGHTLAQAIEREQTIVAFLSPESVISDWVDLELAHALELEQNHPGGRTAVLPIFIGDRKQLVSAKERLNHWFHPITRLVDRAGVDCDPSLGDEENARRIADAVAKRLFEDALVRRAREVILCCEQRTGGNRAEEPELPDELADLDAPCLVIRSDVGNGSASETLVGEDWGKFAEAVRGSLDVALNGSRWANRKRIHICGTGQLALAFELGRHFDYNTDADLTCYGRPPKDGSRRRDIFSISGAMPPGNPDCEADGDPRFRTPATSVPELAIALVAQPFHGQTIAAYLDAHDPQLPRVRVTHAVPLTSSGEVMQLVADVAALCSKYRERGVERFVFFTTLPLHVLPLLAARLRHLGAFTFAEYRTDLGPNIDPANSYATLMVSS